MTLQFFQRGKDIILVTQTDDMWIADYHFAQLITNQLQPVFQRIERHQNTTFEVIRDDRWHEDHNCVQFLV